MTSLAEILSTLKSLKPELERKFHVQNIGVFGSAVRDDFSPKSDVDIIVDFSRPVGIEFIDLADYMEARLSAKVDLVSRHGIKDKYFQQIQQEVIYV